MTVDELQRLAATAPDHQPGDHLGGAGQGQGVLHLHLGHHRHAEGQRDDALPVAAGAGRLRRPRHAADQQRHAVLLPAAVPQQRADGGAVVGAELRRDAGAWQVVLGVEVLGRRHPLRRHRVRLHRRDLRLPAQPAAQGHRPQAQGAGDRRQRAAPGDLGRVHRAVRHRAGLRVLRRQRGQHRVRQRVQRRQDHRHLPDAGGVRRIRRRHRRTGARRQRPGAQGQERRARAAAVEGEQLPAVRRLHRQGRPPRRSWSATRSRRATSGSTPAT